MKSVCIEFMVAEMITRTDDIVIEVPNDATPAEIESLDAGVIFINMDWKPETIWHSEEMCGDEPTCEIEFIQNVDQEPQLTFVRGNEGKLAFDCITKLKNEHEVKKRGFDSGEMEVRGGITK